MLRQPLLFWRFHALDDCAGCDDAILPGATEASGLRSRGDTAAADGGVQASSSQEGAVETYTGQQLLAEGNGLADAASRLGTKAEGGAAAACSGNCAADAPDVQAEEVGGALLLGNDLAQQASAISESGSLPDKATAVGGIPFDDSGFRDPHVGAQRSSRLGTTRSPPGHGGLQEVDFYLMQVVQACIRGSST